jgi:hypothetical protein
MATRLLFDQIRDQHRINGALCGDLEAAGTTDDREERRAILVEAVRGHLSAEEAVFYNALGRVPAAADSVERMLSQHLKIRDASDELARLPLSSTAIDPKIERLRALLDVHADDSENLLFPLADRHLDAATLDMLAVELEDAWQRERGSYGV